MNLRRLFNVVFVTLFCHGPLVCAVAESVDATPFHTDTPDDADFARQYQQLRSENEKLQDTVTELLNRVVDQYLLIDELKRQLKEITRSKTEKPRSIFGWWGVGPLPSWIEEGEEMQVINEGCHTLGCCLSTMLQLWLLILQQIWNIMIILCSDPLSWIGSGWENVRAMIPIVAQILEGLLLFLMLNLIAYVLLKVKSAWERTKSFISPIFKLPMFVVFWGLTCFVYNLLKKTMVKNKERSRVSQSHMKQQKELKELRGAFNELKKQQEDRSMTDEVLALKTQLQQLELDNYPALPAPERQNTNKTRGRRPKTGSPHEAFSDIEDIRDNGRNGRYRIIQNVSATVWSVHDEVGY